MITAKNYAAQAERGLMEHAKLAGDQTQGDEYTSLARQINKSIHFAIPDAGKILDDGLKGLRNEILRLPYPSITIEWFSKEHGFTKTLVLAVEFESTIRISAFINVQSVWECVPLLFTIDKSNFMRDGEIFGKTQVIFEEYYDFIIKNGVTDEEIGRYLYLGARCVFELCEALACVNIEQSIHQPESAKNIKRISTGKLPLYETKFLTIKATRSKTEKNKIGIAGSHATPRQHLRRGHIRRLESGNIWVNSCVVGDSEKGVIKKDYRVEA